MAKPIFVLGHQRSGTTWLANQLSAHPDVAAVQHAAHHGVHESIYFSHIYGRFGDLDDKNNYVRFVEMFGASDYAQLAGASKEWLYSLYPVSYEEVFRAVMDRYASEEGAEYWLEKSPAHTPLVCEIQEMFPDASIIGIIRDPYDVAASAIKKSDVRSLQKRFMKLLKYAWSYDFYNRKLISYEANHEDAVIIDYCDFKNDYEKQIKRLEGELELAHDEMVLETQYPPNTSFTNNSTGIPIRDCERRLFGALRSGMKMLPTFGLRFIGSLPRLIRPHKRLPRWFYKLYCQSVGLTEQKKLR